jgi:EAL domain-containing protein (putative c-di-GMP-specific phosphodiesterase class I)
LLRWTHAVHGPISPAVIVNLAEESCLIHDIGRWTLNQARDVRRWRDLGYGGFTSASTCRRCSWRTRPGRAAWRRRCRRMACARGSGAGGHRGGALGSSAQTDRSLAELSGQGLLLSMDDFGMGSTSLLHAPLSPAHHQARRPSTRDVCASAVDRDIISCVCRLGHWRAVVAEYVETLDQWRELKALGCDRFQGWYFSRALPADEFLDYLARRRPGAF